MKYFIYLFIVLNLYSQNLQKPKVYIDYKYNINSWYMSEKLDGIRAFWDGEKLLSKNGNIIHAPLWFIKDFPKFKLDGELYTKRQNFENIQNIVLDKTPSSKWKEITYNIFEVPNAKGDFLQRLEIIKKWQKKSKNKYIKIIPQTLCKNKKHLNTYLEKLLALKAEGVIIKNPHLNYFSGRSANILKVKKFLDMEGEVISINYNKNKSFKSLVIKLQNNVIFNLGNGFTKKQRVNHPNIGDIVSFKYYGLTKYKKPKFASFLRIRKKE